MKAFYLPLTIITDIIHQVKCIQFHQVFGTCFCQLQGINHMDIQSSYILFCGIDIINWCQFQSCDRGINRILQCSFSVNFVIFWHLVLLHIIHSGYVGIRMPYRFYQRLVFYICLKTALLEPSRRNFVKGLEWRMGIYKN